MQFTIPGYEFPTISDLKKFAADNGITPIGNKTMKQTWENAIDTWHEFNQEAVALAKDAENESQEIAESIEVAVVSVGSLVVAVATSEAAIGIYRGILKAIVLTIVLGFMLTQAALKWMWANKHHAAVCHWVSNWLDSNSGKTAIAHALIAEWVIRQWIEVIADRVDTTAQSWRDAVDCAMGRVGVGGAAIEV